MILLNNASIGSEQKVDGLAPLVDGAVEVVPLSRTRMYVASTRQDEFTSRAQRLHRYSNSGTYRITHRRIVV